MADYYLVELANGPDYDDSRDRREQDGWDEHATFVDAESEDAILARLADDPWYETVLTIVSIRPWSVWLRAP